ncbi:MAG: hypothetical protein CMJ48_13480 [Planctomycetaceae bacterium]|nr:hypothetical protein [Planctomycetaceae bacterium]
MRLLQQYAWPGNVRELINVIERCVVLAKGSVITAGELPETLRREQTQTHDFSGNLSSGSLKTALVAPERQIILDALEANGWNRQNTAAMLGINRTTLYKKMKKYDISFEQQFAG